MRKRFRGFFKCVVQILIVSAMTLLIDRLVAGLSNDDSIWLGESIEVVASIILGPVVGGFSTLISCTMTDFLTYHTLEYSFVGIFEALSMVVISVVYRRLVQDEDQFGVREIVVFNFVQILVNTAIIYLATPPAAVLFFGFIIKEWPREEFATELTALSDNAFSACISIALIGTVLLAVCIAIRKHLKDQDGLAAALRSIVKPSFINKEYRPRAFEYSIGIVFAIALTMVDGVVSGHVLGADALAATSLMFPLISFSSYVSKLITTGCSNLCARAKGDGDFERARELFSLGFFVTIFLGLLQTVLFYFMQNLYFDYFSSAPTIEALARQYYQFYIFVPPFLALATFGDEIAASDGDDMLSYAGYLTSFGINVGLSIFLSSRMGMGGLALATMVSYIGYLLVVSIHFLKKNNTFGICFYFSFRDLLGFAEHSLKSNTTGFCMSAVSTAFTKSILLFWGSEYLIANTVLCAMLEIYEMIKGPSEAAEYLFATYAGEKNSEGITTLFKEALIVCLFGGMTVSLLLLLMPGTVLLLYGIEDSPLRVELIQCIRFCSVGVIAASLGGFLGDYYGDLGKPLWSCMLVIFRTALFPILFCVTFCVDGGIVAMGKGMLLAQMAAVGIFYGFVLIVKGAENIPYMLDDPDFEKVKMNSFEYYPEEYERIMGWIKENMTSHGIDEDKINKAQSMVLSLCKKTEEKSGKNKKVYGECVLRFVDGAEIIIKDNGELFQPDIEDDCYSYNVLMSCNRSLIRM